MDSPYEQNYIFRWDRIKKEKEAVAEIDGPAYFSTMLENDTFVIATSVELLPGEWDKKASIWIKKPLQENWERIAKWQRLANTQGHGMLKLAHPNQSSYLYVTPFKTSGHNSLYKLKLPTDENQ